MKNIMGKFHTFRLSLIYQVGNIA